MNKIVSSLWAGVISGVSCFSTARVVTRYSLLGLNGGAGELCRRKLSTFSTSPLPPQFVTNLNGYGFGNDSLHLTWGEQKTSVFVTLRLSAATLRYYYPSLIEYGQRLHTICTDGTAPLKYPYDPEPGFRYWWTPFSAVNKMFDSPSLEDKFIKSWRDDIGRHMYKNVWDKAWAKNLGVLYTLQLGKDGAVISSAMSLDTSHHKKTATEGGATGVVGDNKFPGNQMKIFFDGALSQMIADQLDTPEKFTDWLLGNASGVKSDFPARGALKQALISNGSWISNWSEQPVWGDEKDGVSLLKKVISNHFTQIRKTATDSKTSGMVIRTVRRTIDFCDVVVEQQRSPHIYLTDDGFTASSTHPNDDRSYSCTFSWKNSVPNLYPSDNSNTFYNRLTGYEETTDHAWSLGWEFSNDEVASDLDDIQKIINGKISKELLDGNEYVSWSHFQERLQYALWYHRRINIKFSVYWFAVRHNHYKVSVNWFNT